MKTRWRNVQPPQFRFGKEVEAILSTLPNRVRFFRNCNRWGQATVRPNSSSVASDYDPRHLPAHLPLRWAERAKTAGYPERFAQLALGHNSKAVHRAYANKAQVTLPPLEENPREDCAVQRGTSGSARSNPHGDDQSHQRVGCIFPHVVDTGRDFILNRCEPPVRFWQLKITAGAKRDKIAR